MRHRCPYRLRSAIGQSTIRGWRKVDEFKAAMVAGQWRWEESGRTMAYWKTGDTICISESHHRVSAALEIGESTGDWSYLDKLLATAMPEEGPLPDRTRRFPRRGIWRRVAKWLASFRRMIA